MAGRTQINWPRVWPPSGTRMWIALFGILLLIGVLAATGLAIYQADGIGGVACIGAAVWLLPLPFLGWMVIAGRREGWGGARGIQIRRGRAVILPYRAASKYLWLTFAVSSVLVFAFVPTLAEMTPYDGSSASARFHAWAPFAPIFVVFPLAGLLSRLIRKRGQLGVGISRSGVYHWSWFGCCFYAWDWIREVRPALHRNSLVIDLVVAEPEHGWDPEENFVARFDSFRQNMQRIQLGHLAVNPAVPLYAIEFYRRHPELRHELGSDKGVERIRNGDLPDVMLEVYNNGRFVRTADAAE